MKDNNGSSIDTAAEGVLTYADLTKLYGEFSDFDMTTVLASPAAAAKIMGMEQMQDMRPLSPAPFCCPLAHSCASVPECPRSI